ncbi:hypothetical protein [Streptomyces sp. NPDC002825]|uniref:hypothetical protein n=1 Tax=Streptomyces sp. NPDC002825 TaxID=3154666 RepID=UPI00332D0739
MRSPLTGLGVSAVALALGITAASLPQTADAAKLHRAESAGHAAAACFWFGPTGRVDDSDDNYAFPDSGARYWGAVLTLPKGARLTFEHEFAHARYQSLNSYNNTTHAPTDALNDISTAPDEGSRNPYLPGAKRHGNHKRAYTATLLGEQPPADPDDRAPNTLYAGVPGQQELTLLYRVYLPDRDRDATGGVGLPRPRLHLADGTTLTGTDVCAAVQAEERDKIPVTNLPLKSYRALREQPGKPVGFPAEPKPVWRTFFNPAFNLACVYQGKCTGSPVKTGGQYSNKDNEYVSTYVSRAFGDVLVLRGKLPVTPATALRSPVKRLDAELRYWSLCSNESYATTRAVACLYDDQLVTDADGNYTIVLSLPEDRPANATVKNGVNWLSLSPKGDGAGHLDDTMLNIRNMLPSSGFAHAVQNTRTPGDERGVMGPYLPTGTYTTTESFEALGTAVR